MKKTLVLALNDLASAVKNKTLLLVLFIPLFVFISLNLVDKADSQAEQIKIGLLENYAYAPEISDSIQAAPESIAVTWLADQEHGLQLLKEHKINGILTNDTQDTGKLALLVLKKPSIRSLSNALTIQIFGLKWLKFAA